MPEKKSVSPMGVAVTALMYVFYVAIMLYIMFSIRNIKEVTNYSAVMLFECIGFAVGAFVMFARSFSAKLDVGYYIPVIGVTLVYTAVLHVLCIVLVGIFSKTLFVLVNALLLFAWCAVCLPMILMGSKR